jgi:hypothetical protein
VFTSKGGKKVQKKNWEAEICRAKKIAELKNMGIESSSVKPILVERVWDRIGKRLIPSSAGRTSLSGIFRTTSPKLQE